MAENIPIKLRLGFLEYQKTIDGRLPLQIRSKNDVKSMG